MMRGVMDIDLTKARADIEATDDLLEMESRDKKFKREWTWEEWQASRAATRAISNKISPAPCRRSESSSDKRLRAAFDGERAPKLKKN